jgi:hypothetical protein
MKAYGLKWGLERSLVLYLFRHNMMLSLRMLSLATRQTHMYLDL